MFLLNSTNDLMKSLDFLWQGMLTLFIAMFLLYIAIIIINKIKIK